MRYILLMLVMILGYGASHFFKKAKQAKQEDNKVVEKRQKTNGIFCSVVSVVVLGLIVFQSITTSSMYAQKNVASTTAGQTKDNSSMAYVQDSISKRLSFDDFKTIYNENAEKFFIENIDEWVIKEGEKADVCSYSYEGRAFSIMLNKNNLRYVQGIMYVFSPSDDQLTTLQTLLKMYTLLVTVDPDVTAENAPTISMELLNNVGEEMVSKSGVEYLLQNVSGNYVLSIKL